MSNVAVQEHISHGDTDTVRLIEVDLSNIESVVEMLNECSYLRLPEPEFGEDAALVSRSYEEIVTQRHADAQRVATELADKGASEIGWVEYRVLKRVHIPILQANGWSRDQINRCF
jgi:hypothetical protein